MGSSVRVFTGIEYTPDGTMHLLTFQIIRSSLPPSRGLGFERSCPSVRVFVCGAALILRIRLSECNARLVSIIFAYEPRLTITNNCYGERTAGVADAVVEGYLAKQRHERVRVVRAVRFRELSL